ncbi:hypothetical protein JDV02_003312 [Purpureocillium takamizusanense]|uniref:Protein kinase domain-containing protein n=1 Tax=Purpureocillium takamizusanense TaxID=2060973 RepID=A0A9Q8QC71_9HYPO|nr:uncharacterized protein JDV02_003312 [Purpureocillium takamizusanense]UNI16930.1 hypothetical protein JDV02_003312 [Purpureocillium takamizusanense]
MTDKRYKIVEFNIDDDGIEIGIRFNGCIFRIELSPNSFVNSPVALERFHRFFKGLKSRSSVASQSREYGDYCENVAHVFRPDFERLAPPRAHTGKVTLADIAARGYFKCDYRVVDEKDVRGAVTACDNAWMNRERACDIRDHQSLFPLFDAAAVEVELPGDGMDDIYEIVPRKIFVDGKPGFYKKCDRPYACLEEVAKYCAIEASGLSTQQLLTSRLLGIVADENGQASGLLYEWIETKAEGVQGTLDGAVTPATPMHLREKWASQIRSTVAELHGLQVAWGDVKADNVLIDEDDDAIVIDLEGGTTDEWVDREIGGTVAGDLQGLEKMVDFILNDKSSLRRCGQEEEQEHGVGGNLILGEGIPI